MVVTEENIVVGVVYDFFCLFASLVWSTLEGTEEGRRQKKRGKKSAKSFDDNLVGFYRGNVETCQLLTGFW
jgi:hypothetical protein